MAQINTNGYAKAVVGIAVFCIANTALASAIRFLGGTGSGGDNAFSLVELNTAPASSNLIGPASFNPGLDFDPTSGSLYGASDSLRVINPNDGSFTTIGTFGSGLIMQSIAFSPTGILFGVAAQVLYQIDKSTAFASTVGTLAGGALDAAWGIDFSPDGTLYGAATSLQIIDPTNAAILSTIGSLGLGTGEQIFDIDYAADGNLYGVSFSSNELFRINTSTAGLSSLGAYNEDLWGLASQSVSAPATFALIGLGLAGMGYRRKHIKAA